MDEEKLDKIDSTEIIKSSELEREAFNIEEYESGVAKYQETQQELELKSQEKDLEYLEKLRRDHSLDDDLLERTREFLLNEKYRAVTRKEEVKKEGVEQKTEEPKKVVSNPKIEKPHFEELPEKVSQDNTKEKDLKAYFLDKFLKALEQNKEELIKRNQELRIFDESRGIPEEAKFMIGKNALQNIAEDPKMPKDKSRKLKFFLSGLDTGRGIARSAPKDEFSEQFLKMNLVSLITELRSIFPEEAIKAIEAIRDKNTRIRK